MAGRKELARVEPYFVVHDDGIRSLDPERSYLLVAPIECHFPEVEQLLCVNESEEYAAAVAEVLALGRRLLPRPDQQEIADARYAFLKEH